MTAPATVAVPNITLDRRAPSRHDSTLSSNVRKWVESRLPVCGDGLNHRECLQLVGSRPSASGIPFDDVNDWSWVAISLTVLGPEMVEAGACSAGS